MITEGMLKIFNSYFKNNSFTKEETNDKLIEISNKIYDIFKNNKEDANNIIGFDMGNSPTIEDIIFWTKIRFNNYIQDFK